eukprot:maker-scaffold_47-snap-gene-1.2-mRNA-1 protein AED:0.00 eAED:0.00 QI:0/0/0/1/1/1/3/0/1392
MQKKKKFHLNGNHDKKRSRTFFLEKDIVFPSQFSHENILSFASKSEHKKISSITFTLQSPQQITRSGEVQINNARLYDHNSKPVSNSVIDARLGTSKSRGVCENCNQKFIDCPGHFGYIKLELPVFHLGYYKSIHNTLSSICHSCFRVLLTNREKKSILKKYNKKNIDILSKREVQKKTVEKCKKAKKCPHCGSSVGKISKATEGTFQLQRKYAPPEDLDSDMEEEIRNFEGKMSFTEELDPRAAYNLLSNIPNEDLGLLWFDPVLSRPENMILWAIPVPPVTTRPSVFVDEDLSNEDDLTMRLKEIVLVNNQLKAGLQDGKKGATLITKIWQDLQNIVATYINSDHTNPNVKQGDSRNKPSRGLVQRLKGKTGRFRGNLSGKRADFTGRTVISPDPNLKISQVGVPLRMAKILTFPENVNKINISALKQMVVNGIDRHPGARYIRYKNSGAQRAIQFLDVDKRKKIAESLRPGDVVERLLMDGDYVLFNRQPSLHRMSIMCHEVKVLDGRTLRFNECVCSPYNADFDGDEMNLHVPQTYEAKAEALELLSSSRNIISPRHGSPIISATQDFFTASYTLTQDAHTLFFTRADVLNVLSMITNKFKVDIELIEPPCIMKPVERWSGKQIFSLFLKDDLNINTEKVVIREGKLMFGEIGKNMLGGKKEGVIYQLCETQIQGVYNDAVMFLNKWTRFCSRFLGDAGFTIGINDVTPSGPLEKKKLAIIQAGYAACEERISQYQNGTLITLPGCNEIESLESEISGILSRVRDDAGKMCMQQLPAHNQPFIMAKCGSKGSPLNICQMVSCVGQQIVGGKRMPNGFRHRSLPHFEKHSKLPKAKGFVANSFFSGLTAPEFFFHTMGGREGLVDTAVKTAETGYMARRLMKALEDLVVMYDGTVRSADGAVVQFMYGEDGLSSLKMEDGVNPVDFRKLLHRFPSTGDLDLSIEESFNKIGNLLRESGEKYYELLNARIQKDLIAFSENDNLQSLSMNFIDRVVKKYIQAVVEPGEGVGALAGQSLGEPGTQMTLKTFHFAGVASMNVTLGVPRLKEIINASKSISTPIITVNLVNDEDERSARIIQSRLERTTLGEISSKCEVVVSFEGVFFMVKLNKKAIRSLHLDVSPKSIKSAILASKPLQKKLGIKLDPELIKVGNDMVTITVFGPSIKERRDVESKWNGTQTWGVDARRAVTLQKTLFTCEKLKKHVLDVSIAGIDSVDRAVVNKDDSERKFHLLVEGLGMLEVLGIPGVDGTKCRTNNIAEIEKVLGIEAARATIMNEVAYIFGRYGLDVDQRHLMLLADVMTYKGEVLGITRFGIAKLKESILHLASFEKTAEHLFDASTHGNKDEIRGVSECIIVGSHMPVGTGMPRIITEWSSSPPDFQFPQRQTLLGY